MKLTPIFPPHIKPVRVGVYLTTTDTRKPARWYSYWNGITWGIDASSPDCAEDHKSWVAFYQNKRWQGVAHG